jgi:GNAT superfamily N-acetyltransferase
MLLSPQEIEQQTRRLWKTCFHDSDDFLDIYFEEKYPHAHNVTLRPDGAVAAAVQVMPYRMTFYGAVLHTGYLSGLGVLPDYRHRGLASRLISRAHRDLYDQGATLSFLIPGDEALRHFYEDTAHGAYWTATYRKEIEMTPREAADTRVDITRPDEWGMDLYVFFRRTTQTEFMLHPSESDFFAAVASCDLSDGYILVARRHRRIVGFLMAAPESDGRLFLRGMLVETEGVKTALLERLQQLAGVEKVYARIPSPGSIPGVTPYAMARVIHVDRFLSIIARAYPELDMEIGVGKDEDIPENNGYYHLHHGRVEGIEHCPENVVTAGGLAALFLAAHPTQVEMMLDE